MSPKSLLLLATLAVTFAVCMSIDCYVCDSLDDDHCDDGDDDELVSHNDTATGCTYCGKEYGIYWGVETVNRTCDVTCVESYTDYSTILFQYTYGKVCCDEDYCNSASGVSPAAMILVSGSLFALWSQGRI